MLTSGDVMRARLGKPAGREAGGERPVVVVTAQWVLDQAPNVVHVVPLTTMDRSFQSEVAVAADIHTGLRQSSAAQCQHLRSVATSRLTASTGRVTPDVLDEVRSTIADLLDI